MRQTFSIPGVDIFGHTVYRWHGCGVWSDMFPTALRLVARHGPIALEWNGLATPLYPGMGELEWWASHCLRLVARSSLGGRGMQIGAGGGEPDWFAVTPR
ncbi:MAG: hypothetical protein Q8S13_13930, partial [Dehalococcoidia bacterium]|nr:hypothetical protein [Dehalococcoidia bacterium]